MAKRYNIKVIEQDSGDVVYEEELIVIWEEGIVLVTNPVDKMICNIERCIEETS